MAKTKMVNFRFREHELDQIDIAAAAAGMTRSAWIRSIITNALTPTAQPVKINAPTPKCINGDPLQCGEPRTKTLAGVKICQTCGIK